MHKYKKHFFEPNLESYSLYFQWLLHWAVFPCRSPHYPFRRLILHFKGEYLWMRLCVTLSSAPTCNFYLIYTVHLRNISHKLIAGINPELFTWQMRHVCCGFLFSAWLETVFKVYRGWMSHIAALFFQFILPMSTSLNALLKLLSFKQI